MAALPIAVVDTLADLQALVAAGGEPRIFLVREIQTVRDAPLYIVAVRELEEAGWDCPNRAQVERTATFANMLQRLSAEVIPTLLFNPHHVAALRRLRSCGQAALKVRRGSAAGPADLYHLAGSFSNSLERMARQALAKQATYTVPGWWLRDKALEAEAARDSSVGFNAHVLAIQGALLPPYVVSTLHDVHALNLLDGGPPRQIHVVAVGALRDAPVYHAAVANKVAAGWTCPNLRQLDLARRFAGRLSHLIDSILPILVDDAEDRDALRDLRACGHGICKSRRRAHGLLADAMGRYSNSLSRAARQALSSKTGYVLTLAWIYNIADTAEDDLYAPIML